MTKMLQNFVMLRLYGMTDYSLKRGISGINYIRKCAFTYMGIIRINEI